MPRLFNACGSSGRSSRARRCQRAASSGRPSACWAAPRQLSRHGSAGRSGSARAGEPAVAWRPAWANSSSAVGTRTPPPPSGCSVVDALQDGQAVVVLEALLEPESTLGQELLDGRPEPLVSLRLALLAEGRRVVQHDVPPRLGSVATQLLLELPVDVPGVEEEEVGLL